MPTNRAAIPPSPKVAERLGVLIAYHGTTKSALARGIGVKPAAVTQWTSGTTSISPANGRRIAEFLDEDYDFVMGLSDKGDKGMGLVISDIGVDRLKLIAGLDEKKKAIFMALVDDFLDDKSKKKPKG